MSTREQVLSKVQQRLGRGELEKEKRLVLEARFAAKKNFPRINFEQDSLQRFVEKVEDSGATSETVAGDRDVVEAVDRYLKRHNIGAQLIISPAAKDLQWPAHYEVAYGPSDGSHQTSVTTCFAGIAETGTVVALSGADTPTTLNFLPDNHIVVIKASQVVKHFEDMWERLPKDLPRTINTITGPSRTADIEQTIQMGAHGPRRLHIIVGYWGHPRENLHSGLQAIRRAAHSGPLVFHRWSI